MPFGTSFSWRLHGLKPVSTKEPYADDSESLLSHDFNGPQDTAARPSSNRRRWTTCTLISILLGTNLLTALISSWLASHYRPFNADRFCAKHTSHPSPLLDEIDIQYSVVDYNGSFFHETIYRQDPSPEVDAAWEDLGIDYRALPVPKEQALKAGITEGQVHIREKYGGGYPANVEGLHHLHCLNLLRQSLKFNYDYYKEKGDGAFKNEEYVVKVHISKCLQYLVERGSIHLSKHVYHDFVYTWRHLSTFYSILLSLTCKVMLLT
jgi:hypothetical protein